MIHFLKLIRPINLTIIGLTMYGTRYYLLQDNYYQNVDDSPINFALLTMSTILIAAAGNIINDYFDVKADRINKPEKLILTKHVERKWAIITHWILNGIAFTIGCYLSFQYKELSFAFIHLVSINLLWFYSMTLKRKAVIGNLIIAGLTGFVPILVAIYMHAENFSYERYNSFDPETWTTKIDYTFVFLLSFFAFLQNLIREMIKDAQDVDGDKVIYVRSVPMLIGVNWTLYVCIPLLLVLPTAFTYIFLEYFLIDHGFIHFLIISLPFLLAAIINVVIVIFIVRQQHDRLQLFERLLKLSMLLGVLSTIYIGYFFQA